MLMWCDDHVECLARLNVDRVFKFTLLKWMNKKTDTHTHTLTQGERERNPCVFFVFHFFWFAGLHGIRGIDFVALNISIHNISVWCKRCWFLGASFREHQKYCLLFFLSNYFHLLFIPFVLLFFQLVAASCFFIFSVWFFVFINAYLYFMLCLGFVRFGRGSYFFFFVATKSTRLGGIDTMIKHKTEKKNSRKKNIEKKNVHTNALTFITFDIAVTGAMKLKRGTHQLNMISVRGFCSGCVYVNFSKRMKRELLNCLNCFCRFGRA